MEFYKWAIYYAIFCFNQWTDSKYFALQHSPLVPQYNSPVHCCMDCCSWKCEENYSNYYYSIAFVMNTNVMASSESRSTVVSGLLIVHDSHFLFQAQWQDESEVCVSRISAIAFPKIWGVTDYSFTELCANKNESVGNAVAFLVKFGSTELILRCSN